MRATNKKRKARLPSFLADIDLHWDVRRDDSGNLVILAENLDVLRNIRSGSVRLIYVDPPFNTGKKQRRTTTRARQVEKQAADTKERAYIGFGGKNYARQKTAGFSYADSFDDYMAFLKPRLEEAHRILVDDGSIFFHVDWRESARCRLLLEEIFGGSDHCINEIIWAYDYGGRSKRKWPAKHDNIYWFAKDTRNPVFNLDAADRIPYMAPGLVTKEKSKKGKVPTDTWWHTIVATNAREKTGYPTQKPLGVLERIVKVHSEPGDLVLDFFAGSGTTGEAARKNGRKYFLVDNNAQAMNVMQKRLGLQVLGDY